MAKQITIFTGYSSEDEGWRNYVNTKTLYISSGSVIPADAEISSITFSFYTRIVGKVKQNCAILIDEPESYSSGTNWYLGENNYIISEDFILDAGGDTDIYKTITVAGLVGKYKDKNGNIYDSEVDYYKNKSSITMCINRYTHKTAGWTGTVYASRPFTCTVEWEDTTAMPIFPSTLTFLKSEVSTTDTVTLSWPAATLPTDASNYIGGYKIIYRNDNNFTLDNWQTQELIDTDGIGYYWLDHINGYTYNCTFPAPTTPGTWYYSLEIFASGDYELSPVTAEDLSDVIVAKLTVDSFTKTGVPSNLKANNLTQLYVGTIEVPELKLTWNKAADGVNNPVSEYTVYKTVNGSTYSPIGSTKLLSYTLDSASSLSANYAIMARSTVADYQNYELSNEVTITQITTKPSCLHVIDRTNVITTNPTIKWGYAETITGATTEYWVYKNSVNEGNLLTITTSSSYTYDMFDNQTGVNAGESFTLIMQPRYVAIHGGYTPGAEYKYSYTRAGAFNLPEPFWRACYDNYNISTAPETLLNIAHKSLLLQWQGVDLQANSSAGGVCFYSLEQQINNGAFNAIGEYEIEDATNNIFSAPLSLDSFAEGTLLTFRVKVTSIYNMTVYSPTISITKIVSPSVSNLSITSVNYEELVTYFEWSYGNLNREIDPLKYQIGIVYNGQESILNGDGILLETNNTWHQSNDSISLNSSELTSALKELKIATIENKIARPKCIVKVYLWHSSYKSTKVSLSLTDVILNYTTKPTNNGTLAFSSTNEKNYYNPNEIFKVKLNNFQWKDAAGGTSGATIRNYLISSYSKNQFDFINNETELKTPATSSDLQITLTLCTSIIYADVTDNIITSQTLSLNVARWTTDSIFITQVLMANDKSYIEGYIQLPEKLCSSAEYNNLTTIIPKIETNLLGNYSIIFYNSSNVVDSSFRPSELPADLKIRFQIIGATEEEYANIILNCQVTFINTSDQSLIVVASPYKFLTYDTDLAIRKGRIGINVSKDFQQYDEGNVSSSTLQINAGKQNSSESPIVEIFTTESGETTKFISFSKSGSLFSTIYSKDENLFIDKLLSNGLVNTDATQKLVIKSNGVALDTYNNSTLSWDSEQILTSNNYSSYITTNLVSSTKDGIVPKFDSVSGTIDNNTTDWVLTNNNGVLGWYQLPANAFKNDDTIYTHPVTSGYKHIPGGGKENQILRWYADGTATWGEDKGTIYTGGHGVTINSNNEINAVKVFYASTQPVSNVQDGDIWLKPI